MDLKTILEVLGFLGGLIGLMFRFNSKYNRLEYTVMENKAEIDIIKIKIEKINNDNNDMKIIITNINKDLEFIKENLTNISLNQTKIIDRMDQRLTDIEKEMIIHSVCKYSPSKTKNND